MDDSTGIDERLQHLLKLTGQDQAKALAGEIAALHRQISNLKREIAALADFRGSRWLSLHGAGGGGPALPRTAVIDADQNLPASDGFYPVEYTSEGVPFRWSGPTPQFFFEVYIDRRNGADLVLKALSCIDFDVQSAIVLMADAESVPVEVVREESGFRIHAALPPRDDRYATNLVFILPKVLHAPEGSDIRPLGLAFNRLEVTSRDVPADAVRKRAGGSTGKAPLPGEDAVAEPAQ
jgi:hypothetical protein